MKRRLKVILSIIVLGILPCLACAQEITSQQISGIVSCIQQKSKALGSPMPRFSSDEIRFHYHLGQYSLRYPSGEVVHVDEQNELRFAVYGPSETRVTVYDIFLTKQDDGLKVEVGNPSSYIMRGSKLIRGDNPGGEATDLYLRQLLEVFAKEKPQSLSLTNTLALPIGVSCQR